MPRRNNRPALYELSRPRSEDGDVSSESSHSNSIDGIGASSPHWLTPGVGVRIPGGFLVLGGVILVGSIIAAWWIGYSSGVATTEAMMAANPDVVLLDPLLRPDPEPIKTTSGTPQGSVESPVGPLISSERPWHFVLAETNQPGADRLAEFCRLKGLEVMVIPRHNTGLARVIAMPGMETSSRQVPEVKAQDQLIAVLGRQWKQNGGRTDFSDRYMDRIEPELD